LSASSEALRLGLIGAGRWGRNYIRTLAGLDCVRLARVASRNPETAELVPAGCEIAADWQEIVSAPDLDGVIIATPPATHFAILVAAIESGKPVLVEKPVVQSLVHANDIRALLDRKPVPVLIDHVHLFHPAFRELCREAAGLGPVRGIESSAGNRGPYRPDVSVLWDWAPHDLAMALTLAPGPPRPISATRLETQEIGGVRAERIALALSIGDIPVRIQVSTLDERHRWFAARFDDRTLVYRDKLPGQLVQVVAGEERALAVPAGPPPLTTAVLEFASAIRQRRLDPRSIDVGLATVELISGFEGLLI
jgi:predicted dehydrogenase